MDNGNIITVVTWTSSCGISGPYSTIISSSPNTLSAATLNPSWSCPITGSWTNRPAPTAAERPSSKSSARSSIPSSLPSCLGLRILNRIFERKDRTGYQIKWEIQNIYCWVCVGESESEEMLLKLIDKNISWWKELDDNKILSLLSLTSCIAFSCSSSAWRGGGEGSWWDGGGDWTEEARLQGLPGSRSVSEIPESESVLWPESWWRQYEIMTFIDWIFLRIKATSI